MATDIELDYGAHIAADMAFIELSVRPDVSRARCLEAALIAYKWWESEKCSYGPSLNEVREFLWAERFLT